MNAKKANESIGGHGLAMWAMFGFLPTWLRTYRLPPKHSSKNLSTISQVYDLSIGSAVQGASFVSALKTGLSHRKGYLIDDNTIEGWICKFGRELRHSKNQWRVWMMPNQILFCAYYESN